ncbi:MAG: hypothetical protein HRT89_09750, partial [Lentisphaeria bacterium]|nr:hypothetical protein [Lentisphaeria bacterium]
MLLRTAETIELINLDDGKRLWQAAFPKFRTYFGMHLSKSGAHLFGQRNNKKIYAGTLDSYDTTSGKLFKTSFFPERPRIFRFNESHLWMLGLKGRFYHMDLNSRAIKQFGGTIGVGRSSRPYIHDVKGGTVFLEAGQGSRRKRMLFYADNPKAKIILGPGNNYLLKDDLVCEIRGRRLRVHNPKSKKTDVVAIVPPSCEIKDYHLAGNLLYIASVQSPARQELSPVRKAQFRIDVFDRTKNRFVYGKRLPVDPAYWSSKRGSWGNQFVWTETDLFITDAQGLHVIALSSEKDLNERKIIYRSSKKLVIDGHNEEFIAIKSGLMPDKYKDVKIYATHDDRFLYLSVSYTNTQFSSLLGSGRFGGDGDWVEFTLASNKTPHQAESRDLYQWDLGIDNHGRTVHRRSMPGGIYSVIRHDTESMQLIYESAIPLSQLSSPGHFADRSLNLSVSVYDSDMKPGSPIARWVNMPIYLHAYTKTEEQAALLLARSLPYERESYWLLRKMLRIHVKDWPVGRSFVSEQLKRSSPINSGMPEHQMRMLKLLHKHQKNLTQRKPAPMVTAFAKTQGVSKEALDWYAKYAKRPKTVRLPKGKTKDPAVGIALLKKTIPLLGGTDIADPFFTTLIHLTKPVLDDELKQFHWFLKKLPHHPRAIDYLYGAWEIEMTKSKKTAAANMDKMMLDCKIPGKTIYEFRRSRSYLGHHYIKDWHVLGPFPDAFEKDAMVTPLPHMKAKIKLTDKYVFPKQTLVWKRLTSKTHEITPVKHRAGVIHSNNAYAVTWVQMEKAGMVVLEFAHRGAARVWINRRMVVSDPGESGVWSPGNFVDPYLLVKPFPVYMPKGWSRILVEIAPRVGGWRFTAELVQLDGKAPVPNMKVMVPQKGAVPIALSINKPPAFKRGQGLKTQYFNEGNLTNLVFVKMEEDTRMVWHAFSPDPRVGRESFSWRMIGKIKPRYTETYTFTCQVNDGIRLWIDGKLLVHNWKHHSTKKDRARIKLEKDKLYDIKIEGHENTDWALMYVWWRSPSQRHEIIPNERLFANWYDTDTYISDERATKPGGPPRFAGYRITPSEVWLPSIKSLQTYRFKAIPLDQYGARLRVSRTFDEYGKPVDTSAKWSVEKGGYLNMLRMYGAAHYLPNVNKQAFGTITQGGVFKGDGSLGIASIVVTSKKYPDIQHRVPVAIDSLPTLTPHKTDLLMGQFAGDVDDLRISTRMISAKEIAERYKGKITNNKNLIAHWTFDTIKDGHFPNVAPGINKLHAKIKGQVLIVKEPKRTVVRFDGGYCIVKNDRLLDFSQNVTFEAWVRPINKNSGGSILNRDLGGTPRGWRLFLSSGGFASHALYGHGSMHGPFKIPSREFTYLVWVFGSNGVRQHYANGKLSSEWKPRAIAH